MVNTIVFTAVIDTIVAVTSGGILFFLIRIFKWGHSVEERLDRIEDAIKNNGKL